MFKNHDEDNKKLAGYCNNLSTLRSAKSYAIPADFVDPEKEKYVFDSHGHILARKR